MAGRKQFLLANIPNRVSHKARCVVIIVNTAHLTGLAQPAAVTQPDHETPVGQTTPGPRASDPACARQDERSRAPESIPSTRTTPCGSAPVVSVTRCRSLGRPSRSSARCCPPGPTCSRRKSSRSCATLQEKVTPLTEQEVVAAMERELGVPWEDVFASIDPQPIAAGTIGQVHHATLESGDRVVVKIQRPTAERDIALDLGLLERLGAKMAARPGSRRVIDVPLLIRQFSESLRRELDFRREAANAKRHGRSARAVHAAGRAEGLRGLLDIASAGDAGGRRRAPERGAAWGGAKGGGAAVARVVLQAGARRRVLPCGPAPGKSALVERQDLLPRHGDGRRGRAGRPRADVAADARVRSEGRALSLRGRAAARCRRRRG